MREWATPGEDIADYLRDIGQHPLLTANDEVELARRIDAGRRAARELSARGESAGERVAELERLIEVGRRARQRMVESNLRLVVSVARRYRGHGLSLPDLIQEGSIGLQAGIDRYDWRKGFRLSTYAYWWIRQAIVRAIANDGRIIRVPVRIGEQIRYLARAEQRLQAELGREPTLAEVAAHVGIKPDRLLALRLAAAQPVSLDAPVDAETSTTRADVIADDAAGPEPLVVGESDDLRVPVAVALESLPAREREVLRLHYGFGQSETWSLAQIGARLGVTRERARQLEGQALRRLRSDIRLRRALVELRSA